MVIQDAIKTVIGNISLSRVDARDVFGDIMNGKATDAQIAAFIVALRMKGETVDEITAAAEIMREKAEKIMPADSRFVVDTCGTGGDGSDTFNISTAAALVAAGAGARVAKHGNRSVSSRCGSADVLEALGVKVALDALSAEGCLNQAGICFMFAPAMHKAMKFAAGPRKEIGVRTIFNILGPLTNPAGAPAQVLGVFSAALVAPLAQALNNLGSRHAYVVHGSDGLDEITLCAETLVAEVVSGMVKTYSIKPEDYGFKRCTKEALAGGTPNDNAAIIRTILSGVKGAPRDIVILNAAFALTAAGVCDSVPDGLIKAANSIDSGAAAAVLSNLVEISNRVAAGI